MVALHVKCIDTFIVVGDIMRSVSLLKHDPTSTPILKEVARDFHANWITALQPVTKDCFVGETERLRD